MDPVENEALEEAMLQYVIEASLKEVEDDIVEIDPGADQVYPRPISEADEQIIDVA